MCEAAFLIPGRGADSRTKGRKRTLMVPFSMLDSVSDFWG